MALQPGGPSPRAPTRHPTSRRWGSVIEVLHDVQSSNKDAADTADNQIWEIVGDLQKPGDPIPFYDRVYRFGEFWDLFFFRSMRVLACIDAIWVPFLVCFLNSTPFYKSMNAIEFLADFLINFVYGLGVLMQLRTSVVDLDLGREYVDLYSIVDYRKKSRSFQCDVLSMVGILWFLPGLRPLALFRLFRVWRLPSHTYFIYELSSGQMKQPALVFVELAVSIWLITHIFACTWFASVMSQIDNPEIVPDQMGDGLSKVYLTCLHDGAALLSGSQDPKPTRDDGHYSQAEAVALVVLGPLGAMYLAFVFAQLLVLLEWAGASTAKHRNRVSNISAIMHSLHVPVELKKRILQYHTFLSVHNVNKGAYAELCSGLSKSLHQELKMHLFETLVLTAPFFQEIPSSVVVHMVMAFEEDVFAPGDLIINQGEVGSELYFVIKGWCEVLIQVGENKKLQVVAVKRVGDYFGEVALVLDQLRTATIRAKTFCILAKLTRASFDETLKNAPYVKENMIAQIVAQSGGKLAVPQKKAEKEADDEDGEKTPLLSGCREASESRIVDLEALEDSPLRALTSSRRFNNANDCPEVVMPPFHQGAFSSTSELEMMRVKSWHQQLQSPELQRPEAVRQHQSGAPQQMAEEMRQVNFDLQSLITREMEQLRLSVEVGKSAKLSDKGGGKLQTKGNLQTLTDEVQHMRRAIESVEARLSRLESESKS